MRTSRENKCVLMSILFQNYILSHVSKYIFILPNSNICSILVILNDDFSIFFNTGIVISMFLLVSLCPNHRGKWDTGTHEGIILLPWKYPILSLWTFCSLRRRDQGLTMSSFGFIRFTVFNYSNLTKKCLILPQVTLTATV